MTKDFSIQILAEDLKLLLDSLQIDKAVFIGHSMGGLTVQAFFEKYPEQVLGLGLWDTGVKMPFGYGIKTTFYILGQMSFLIGLLLSYPISPLFRFMLAQCWKVMFKEGGKSPAYLKYVPSVKALSKKAVIRAAAALSEYDGQKAAQMNQIPTMLLQGKYDKMAPPMPLALKLKKLIPHAKLYIVEKAGHFPPNEQPDEVKTYLDEILKSNFFLRQKDG